MFYEMQQNMHGQVTYHLVVIELGLLNPDAS